MAITLSRMIPLGTIAPDFDLPNMVTGQFLSLQSLKSPTGTVIMFLCNHCPFVKHLLPEIIKLAHDYEKKGIVFVGISSNDAIAYPEDAPHKMTEVAKAHKFPFPYLFDESQEVAKAYHAECTPDFFVFDGTLKCVYRGQFDESRPSTDLSTLTGKDLRAALECLLNEIPIDSNQKPSMGCDIKWKE